MILSESLSLSSMRELRSSLAVESKSSKEEKSKSVSLVELIKLPAFAEIITQGSRKGERMNDELNEQIKQQTANVTNENEEKTPGQVLDELIIMIATNQIEEGVTAEMVTALAELVNARDVYEIDQISTISGKEGEK